MELFLFIGALVVAAVIYLGYKEGQAKEAARQRYLASLAALKKAPTNADIKQATLALGRAYSALTRDKKGQTLFDEVALMNDINAACAAATATRSLESVATPSGASVEERLALLSNLKAKGVIDSVEYDKRRSEILAGI